MRVAAVAALAREVHALTSHRQAWAQGIAGEWRDAVFGRFESDCLDELDRLDRQLLQALQALEAEYNRAERLR